MAHDRFGLFYFCSCYRRWLTLVVLAAAVCSSAVSAAQRPKSGKDVKSQKEVLEDEYTAILSLIERYRAADASVVPEIGRYWYRLYTTDRETIQFLFHRVPIEIAPLAEMSLTDAALAAFEGDETQLANRHLETAERLFDVKLSKTTEPIAPSEDLAASERQRRFAIDWYKAIIWLRCARLELREEKAVIDRALDRFPSESDVLLAAGTYEELMLTRGRVVMSGDPPARGQHAPGQREKFVDMAVRQNRAVGFFREAIRVDPNAVEARIRLAFLFTTQGDRRREEGVSLLREARAIENKPPLGYLAALFAGNIEEERKQLDAASTWYRTAIADCPRAQTARLAFSHLQLAQHDNVRPAQNTLRPLIGGPSAAREGCEPDPWRLYDFGQAWRLYDHLDNMRRMVREQPEKSEP